MIDYKITRKTKILEVNNDMCHNYYFLVRGRIYNKEKTKYKKFGFVEWFDIFDVMEYFEKDYINKNDISNYLNDLIFNNMTLLKDYDNTKNFFDFCNESIENYNKIKK